MLFLGSLTFTRKPDKPTIVVEGVNSTNVDLTWDILLSGGEVVQNLFFIRQRPGDVNQVAIASRRSSTSFTLLSDSFANEYRANLPSNVEVVECRQHRGIYLQPASQLRTNRSTTGGRQCDSYRPR